MTFVAQRGMFFCMKRNILEQLVDWKDQRNRKPLLLQGARQVGKTYILEKFGTDFFPRYHHFDFVEDPQLKSVFEENLVPERVLQDLSVYRDVDIIPKKDLIIFDEIQECPKALSSLKYFAEKLPQTFIASSGSLLGTSLGEELFPVGKVSRLKLHPMNFLEFLAGIGQDRLEAAMKNASTDQPLSKIIHDKLWRFFKFYLITGGLPEVVNAFSLHQENLNRAFKEVRQLQKELVSGYLDDISKHSGKIKAVKIEAVFKDIPRQIARETRGVKKFVFKDVLPMGSRYAALEGPIEWLLKAGLVHKTKICSRAQLPLDAYADGKRFKLYLFDVGILGAMLDLPPKVIYNYDYGTYKGYVVENFVLTEFVSKWNKPANCWQSNTSEIEFLLEIDGHIVPVEVKAGVNTKAKSLRVYIEKFSPKMTLLLTALPMKASGAGRERLPLYMAHQFPL